MLMFYKHPLRGKEKMMVNVFYKNRNTIGQFMVALIFLGTFGFLFTFDGFVPKLQASGCCSGGEAAVTSFAADSSGDYGSAIPMDAEPTDGCCGADCTCLGTDCGSCNDDNHCSKLPKIDQNACPKNNSCEGTDNCGCDGSICVNSSQCNGACQ